jgi:hypothetical protein
LIIAITNAGSGIQLVHGNKEKVLLLVIPLVEPGLSDFPHPTLGREIMLSNTEGHKATSAN